MTSPQQPTGIQRHGVVGVDGSAESLHALAFACGWAHRTGSRLVLVYAVDPRWEQATSVSGTVLFADDSVDVAAQLRLDIEGWMEHANVEWTFVVRGEVCPRALEQVATEHHADAIIVGRSRRRRLRRPTSYRLARRSRRVVITVP